jgi:hypothetical protein
MVYFLQLQLRSPAAAGPTAIDATPTDAACGANNGSIRINDVTGVLLPYEYSIDGGGYGKPQTSPVLVPVHIP